MEISIRPETQKFLEQKMQRGAYRSIDEVIEAGLAALEMQDEDFEKGEVYEGEEVVQELREMSAAKRRETH